MDDKESTDIENNSQIPFIRALALMLQQIAEPDQRTKPIMRRVSQALTSLVDVAAASMKAILRYSNYMDRISETGWLPNRAVTLKFVEDCKGNSKLLDTRLSCFYRENWDSIRGDIESRLDQYHISEEAKSTLCEALTAHGLGLYRCVCRVLFPEIEKEIRAHYFMDRAGPIRSIKMLEKLLENRDLSSFMPKETHGWVLFCRLFEHLYESVNNENRDVYMEDDVPNRHAAIHGLVPYSTHKHSVNMIFIADYFFQILPDPENNEFLS